MMLRTTRSYSTLAPAPTRGALPPMVGVIVPIARTNLVTNPSIELATTGYTASGGSIARSATQQYHGTYSLAVTPTAGTTDGAYYAIALTTGTIYAFSCKVKGIAGVPYKISMASTAPADLSVVTFTATGRWQWVYGYYLETATTTRRFYVTKNGSTNTGIFYVDGVQVEVITAGETVSTYIDGDQLGLLVGQQPPAYGWNGTPHASTSYRTALTRAGGYVVNLSLYNFLLTGIIGLGMAVPNNVSIPYTVLDGARFQRTTKPPRTIALTGRFQADDLPSLMAAQSDMRQVVDRDLVPLQQPLVLQVEPQDNCGQAIGDFANIQCIYAGGLEGNDGNVPVEDVAPTFTMYVPYLSGGDAGVALTVQQTVTNTDYIAQRSAAGVWSAMGTGANNAVNTLVMGLDNSLYAGGDFTLMGGVANTARIAKWDGASWTALGTGGAGGSVRCLAVGPDGTIYAGGSFTSMGGVANTNFIAKWNGSAWTALGTGASGGTAVYTLVVGRDGSLYAGGDFTSMGGVANTLRVAKWNGSAWSALSTGANNNVLSSAAAPSGAIYFGGDFTSIGGVALNRLAAWNGTTFVGLGTGGMDNTVNALAFSPNNRLYAGGNFTTAGGVAVARIAAWNGTGWTPLGSGLSNQVFNNDMAFDARGNLWVGGAFGVAGGITLPDAMAVWNGSAWVYPDVDLPSTPTVYKVLPTLDGRLFAGYPSNGSSVSAANTTAANDTPSYVYPRLTIYGPSSGTSRIYQFVNYTTGFGMWLNLTLSAGEVATFNFDPQALSFTTTFQGDITNTILPGSQPALMYLAPGANSMSFFAASSTVTATLSWQRRYNGLADLVN